jgi:GTP-binding protein
MRLPVVAIVGRPNVGKSTLFNRLLGRRQAVVDEAPGVTRDRNVGLVEWAGRAFYLVDTGGWYPGAREGMEARIAQQVTEALRECDAVLFVTDAHAGAQPLDAEISRALREQAPGVPVLLVVNKVDAIRWEAHAHEFHPLGWEAQHAVSALEGRGIGDALDALLGLLPPGGGPEDLGEGIRIALLGRPNVGKSSLTNRLLGRERVIVDAQPGTTRDTIDVPMRWHGRTLWLVDTAGIRHRWDAVPGFEFYASLRSIRALDRADVVLLVLDATAGVLRQDQRIASLIEESGRAALILVNKWDLVEKETMTATHFEEDIREALSFLSYAPIVFVSALTGQRVLSRLPEQIVSLWDEAQRTVPTGEINRALQQAVEQNAPRAARGQRRPRILYATQVRTGPPTFVIFAHHPAAIGAEYLRYLSRRLREAFGFVGSPIRIRLREATGRRAQRPPR